MMEASDDNEGEPIGWMIVAIGDDGSILCERNGKRKRWNLQAAEIAKLKADQPIGEKCQVCGFDWTDHLGVVALCQLRKDQNELNKHLSSVVRAQAAEITELKAEIERLKQIERDKWTGWAAELKFAKE